MLKPDEDVLEAADARPKREKHQEPNAKLKRERHLHPRPDVNRQSERKHLLETYSDKYEFRAQQIGEVYQERVGLILRSSNASEFRKKSMGRLPSGVQRFGQRPHNIPLPGHRKLYGLFKDHFSGSRKSNQSKREQS